MSINALVARAFDSEPGAFRDANGWHEFLQACGDFEGDPAHITSWIFSSLYWDRLTRFKITTTWLFINGLRLQNRLPICRLTMNSLGRFLDDLSGSGPPIYDGQTFHPDRYE